MAGYTLEKNSRGWKDREFIKDKRIDIFRIACIGDSVTEGYRVELENIFPKILERYLQDIPYDVEVMNLGRGGNTTSDNLKALKGAMEFSPDLIIYQFGLNDIEGFEHMEHISDESNMTIRGITVKKKNNFNLKSCLAKSVLYLTLAERYNYVKLKAGYNNWAFDEWDVKDAMWEKEFTKLKEVFDEIKKTSNVLVAYLPYDFQVYSSREEAFGPSKRLGRFCQDNGYYFLDFTAVFKAQSDRYSIFLDDCHLSDYGHRITADYLKDFILNNGIIRQGYNENTLR
ncbi:MAG: GDSL-type esterase/lipase family protein [Candidatus Omnitrophota bacterium]